MQPSSSRTRRTCRQRVEAPTQIETLIQGRNRTYFLSTLESSPLGTVKSGPLLLNPTEVLILQFFLMFFYPSPSPLFQNPALFRLLAWSAEHGGIPLRVKGQANLVRGREGQIYMQFDKFIHLCTRERIIRVPCWKSLHLPWNMSTVSTSSRYSSIEARLLQPPMTRRTLSSSSWGWTTEAASTRARQNVGKAFPLILFPTRSRCATAAA